MSEVKQVPKLRFKEFSDSWSKVLLNDIATFLKGKSISKSDIVEDGEKECIRYGELYTDYNEIIDKVVSKTNLLTKDLIFSKKNDIIIPSSGETQLDIATASCVIKDNVALGGDLNIIRTKEDGIFIAYYLNNAKKKAIASLAQGNSVVHLYNHQLKGLNLNLPDLKEQQKIATFLSSVDKKIEQLQQKKTGLEQYKKGIMQQVFSQKLRFKDDNGKEYPEWKKINHQITIIAGNAYEYKDYVQDGIVLVQGVNITPGKLDVNSPLYISNDKQANHVSLKFGDILLALNRPITNGQLKVCRYNLKNEGYLYQRAGKLEFNDNEIDSTFLYQLLRSEVFMKKINIELVGSDQPYIKSNLFKIINLLFPVKLEQTKIANFLSAIDAKIQLVTTQIEYTQQFKKGLLQQMFV